MATDEKGILHRIPPVDWNFAGFPCQDVSPMNQNAKRARLEVREGRCRTGSVFKDGVLGFAKKRGADLCATIMENVLGLAVYPPEGGPSPLDWAVWNLQEGADQYVFTIELDPREFGFQVARPRLWLVPSLRKRCWSARWRARTPMTCSRGTCSHVVMQGRGAPLPWITCCCPTTTVQ